MKFARRTDALTVNRSGCTCFRSSATKREFGRGRAHTTNDIANDFRLLTEQQSQHLRSDPVTGPIEPAFVHATMSRRLHPRITDNPSFPPSSGARRRTQRRAPRISEFETTWVRSADKRRSVRQPKRRGQTVLIRTDRRSNFTRTLRTRSLTTIVYLRAP